MSYEYETLKVEVADHICTVMLHRPHRRNALNPQGYSDLEAVFRQVQEDPEVRVVVLTGCEGAFCAGEDVKEMMTGKPATDSHARLRKPRPSMTPAAEAILACDRPIIAAVNGVAVGWGMDLSLLADMRVASTEARFASLFVKRGLITDLGGLWRLPKLVGPERAAELIFSGRMIDGAEAAALGMVLEVVPADELMTRAQALAMSIAENPPLAVRYLKEGLRRSTWSDPEPMGSWISQTLGVLFATEDHREGVASFLEKRPPKFTGSLARRLRGARKAFPLGVDLRARGEGDAIDGHREGGVGAPAHFDQVVIFKGKFNVGPEVAGRSLATLTQTAVYVQGEVIVGFGDHLDGMTGKV